MLPLIGKLFRLQQMKENAPADFRIPLPLSITESTRLGVGASRGSTSNRARVLNSPKRVPQCSLPTPSLQASESVQTEGHTQDKQLNKKTERGCIVYHLCLHYEVVLHLLRLYIFYKTEQFITPKATHNQYTNP